MVLDAAAVQGVLFDADRIAEVVGQPVVGVLQELAELERQRGIVRPAGRLYRFGHNLLQDVVYGALPERLRAEYHTRFADSAATGLTGDASGTDAEFLAFHYLRGVDPERAMPYLGAALDYLEEAFRHESALDLIDRALALEAVKGRERLELLLRRAMRLDFLNRHEQQRDTVQDARQLSEELGDAALRARTWFALGSWLQVVGREPEGLEAFERAVELAALSGDRRLEANYVTRVGGALARLRRSEDALVQHERALQLTRDLKDRAAEMRALTNRANTLRHLSRYNDASEAYEEAIALAQELGDRVAEIFAIANLGVLRTKQGRWRDAEKHLRAQIEFARKSADRRLEAQGTGNLAIALRLEGRLAEARELLVRYRSLCREVGNRRALCVAAGETAHLEFLVGHLDRARQLADEGRRRAIETHAPQLLASDDNLMGKIAFAEGLHAEAMAHFRTAVESYRAIDEPDMLAESLIDAGSLEAEVGANDDALRTLDEAVRVAEALPASPRLCRALAHRARITRSAPDAARARALLESHGDTFALYDRIDVAWALFVATADPALREHARRDLERMRENAAPEDQPGLRGRLPLYRSVSSAG
jgi:tetratricopeptide (TPR) repeat protein